MPGVQLHYIFAKRCGRPHFWCKKHEIFRNL